MVLGWCQTIAAVVLSTVAYMCETVDSFNETFGSGFFVVESLFVAVFTLELLVKISCTPSIPLLFKARLSCFSAWLCLVVCAAVVRLYVVVVCLCVSVRLCVWLCARLCVWLCA